MNSSDIFWNTLPFSEISTKLFHDIIQLRINVFVVEQDCPYPELDNKDILAHHVYAENEQGEIVATARLLPKGVSYNVPSIGRVVVHQDYRDKKLGHDLMKFAITETKRLYPNQDVKISAQEHLKGYYEKHGFEQVSEMYLEDDIPHIAMLHKV